MPHRDVEALNGSATFLRSCSGMHTLGFHSGKDNTILSLMP